jgi:uncharacterized protein YjiS (DUF1127 family)
MERTNSATRVTGSDRKVAEGEGAAPGNLRAWIIAMIDALNAVARRAYARRQQRRQARATCDALRGLDDGALRDLGFDRSEITSVAAEVTGAAESTRVRSLSERGRVSSGSAAKRPAVSRIRAEMPG